MARRRVPGVRRRPGPLHLLLSRPWVRAPLAALTQPGASAAVLVATAVLGVAAATAPLFLSSVATGALHRAVATCPDSYRPAVTNGSADGGGFPLPGPATELVAKEDATVRGVLARRGVPAGERVLVLGQGIPTGDPIEVTGSPGRVPVAVTVLSSPVALGRVELLTGGAEGRGLWLPAQLAERVGARSGDRVTVRDRAYPVAGVYRGLDDPAYGGSLAPAWCRWSKILLPRITDDGPAVRPLVLADERTLLELAGTERPWTTWFAAIDPATARAGDATAVAAGMAGAGMQVQLSPGTVGVYRDEGGLLTATDRAAEVRSALSAATRPAALAADPAGPAGRRVPAAAAGRPDAPGRTAAGAARRPAAAAGRPAASARLPRRPPAGRRARRLRGRARGGRPAGRGAGHLRVADQLGAGDGGGEDQDVRGRGGRPAHRRGPGGDPGRRRPRHPGQPAVRRGHPRLRPAAGARGGPGDVRPVRELGPRVRRRSAARPAVPARPGPGRRPGARDPGGLGPAGRVGVAADERTAAGRGRRGRRLPGHADGRDPDDRRGPRRAHRPRPVRRADRGGVDDRPGGRPRRAGRRRRRGAGDLPADRRGHRRGDHAVSADLDLRVRPGAGRAGRRGRGAGPAALPGRPAAQPHRGVRAEPPDGADPAPAPGVAAGGAGGRGGGRRGARGRAGPAAAGPGGGPARPAARVAAGGVRAGRRARRGGRRARRRGRPGPPRRAGRPGRRRRRPARRRPAGPAVTAGCWGPPGPLAGSAVAACNDVTKVYRLAGAEVLALDGVDKAFPAGRVTTVVGPSGSGKSSLLRILALVDRPTTGSVRIRREEVGCVGVRGRRLLRRTEISYLFQDPSANLVESLDATGQLRFAARLRGLRPEPAEVTRLLTLLGLEHRAGHHPRQLSGGEQQRLAVACAVMGRPSIVIADEPTAELDSASADRVLAAFADLGGEGVAFVLSSHDPRVVERTDHLLRLEHGRPVESW